MSSEPLEPQDGNPIMGFRPEQLRDVKFADLAIRFAFGAGVSAVAAGVGKGFTPVVGGMFLAFPAILPASLTLLEQKHGTEDAVHDVRGAVLGSLGLVAFALVAAVLFTRVTAPVVLGAATAAWLVTSVGLYLAVAAWRHRRRGPAHPERRPDAEPPTADREGQSASA
jgi:hypothetical protein